jgi:hypothetical protein
MESRIRAHLVVIDVYDYEMMFMRAASGTRAHSWFAAFLAGTSPGALPSEASLARLPSRTE